MKFSHRIHIAVSALLLTWSAAGERSPLQRPGYSTDLGDTSKDYESYNAKSNHWVASDSYARASFDSATGTYHFRFKDNAGVWHEAHWMTNSSAEVEFAGSITRLDNNLLQYGYRVAVLPNSIRDLTRITIETASDVADPTGLGKLSAPERRKYWQTGEWVGRELSKSWGRRLWTWTRFLENLSQDERRKDSVLHLVSKGLPVTTSCWVQSDGGYLFSEYEPPYSLSRFHSLRNGILKDAATGLTIAPGLNFVQLPALKAYLDTSIEQGWLEAGEYLD